MKNKIILLSILIISLVGVISCEDETTAGFTRTTYYPEIKIKGEKNLFLPTGTKYVDMGAVSTENGKEIKTEVKNNVNFNKPGTYTIDYSATNTDGFSKTVHRTILVYDKNLNNNDLSGEYIGSVSRLNNENGTTQAFSDISVTLTSTDIAAGVYKISDWISGFYASRYGEKYLFKGLIQINNNNEIFEISMQNVWGDPFNSVTGTYDPATKKIKYSATWLEKDMFVFTIELTKK